MKVIIYNLYLFIIFLDNQKNKIDNIKGDIIKMLDNKNNKNEHKLFKNSTSVKKDEFDKYYDALKCINGGKDKKDNLNYTKNNLKLKSENIEKITKMKHKLENTLTKSKYVDTSPRKQNKNKNLAYDYEQKLFSSKMNHIKVAKIDLHSSSKDNFSYFSKNNGEKKNYGINQSHHRSKSTIEYL
jgi:hypothetical protein